MNDSIVLNPSSIDSMQHFSPMVQNHGNNDLLKRISEQRLPSIDFQAKRKEYKNSQLNFLYITVIKIVNFILKIFNKQNMNFIKFITDHNYSVVMFKTCDKFIEKIKINVSELSEANIFLLHSVFNQNRVDPEAAISAYKACKYLRCSKLISNINHDLNGENEVSWKTNFELFPKSVKRSIYTILCLANGKKALDEAFAKQLLEQNPKILMDIRDGNDKNLLNQLDELFLHLENVSKDLSLLSLHQQNVNESPDLANLYLDKLTEVSQKLIDLEAVKKAATPMQKSTLIDNAKMKLKESLHHLEHITRPLFGHDDSSTVYDASIERMAQELPKNLLNEPLTVAMVGVEYSSFIKQGGLAEALEGIAKSVIANNPQSKVRLIFPKYNKLPKDVVERLYDPPRPFVDAEGKLIDVSVAVIDGVECFFIGNEAFELEENNPSVYGPNDEKCKKRFAAFSGLAADLLSQMDDNDIIHLHDWHVAGVALKLSKQYRDEWEQGKIPPIVFTFHNNSRCAQGRPYAGAYNYNPVVKAIKENGLADEDANIFVETLKIADVVTTVSETFAREAQTPQLGEGISFAIRKIAQAGKLAGIVNGADINRFNPEKDKNLKQWIDPETGMQVDLSYGQKSEDIFGQKLEAKKQLQKWLKLHFPTGRPPKEDDDPQTNQFTFDPNKPIVTYIGRFDSYQKGLDKLDEAIESTLKSGGQFILMGSQEDSSATETLDKLEKKYPSGVLFIRDFKDNNGRYHYQQGNEDRPGISSVIRAATDFIFAPSRYEPCGLIQFEGWLFGSQVIGSNTGGLSDTIISREKDPERCNGYLFDRNSTAVDSASHVIATALEDWNSSSTQEINETARRLIKESRQYGWATAPQGASPADKYRVVYQKAIQQVKLRKKSSLPHRFDVRNYLCQTSAPKTISTISRAAQLEEQYLNRYYFDNEDSEKLDAAYLNLDPGTRCQVSSPYGRGVNFKQYNHLGARIIGEQTIFTVEAPAAKEVTLRLYDNNENLISESPLVPKGDGKWSLQAACQAGQKYQYKINGRIKIDPYGLSHVPSKDRTKAPYSIVCDKNSFVWNDKNWLAQRNKKTGESQPMSIFEMHPTAWMRKANGEPLNYRELAERLVAHCKEAHFTHVELMGILEHPCEASMGYQVTGFFAPNSRLGSIDDFKYLINHLHENKIGVILDWTPAHFAKDPYGLNNFDGTNQFDPSFCSKLFSRRYWRYFWGTKFFDYNKKPVRDFLISSAMYWIREMHVDGLRVDAVSSMRYSENARASKLFMKDLNAIIHKHSKGVITIAEDYSGNTRTTQAAHARGLGFDMKWNIGWMHNTLNYFSSDPNKRRNRYANLINAIDGDKFHKMVLALSHDEIKKGMKSLLNKATGLSKDARLANVRAMLSFMMAIPGKKLNMMGNEFASEKEWTEYLGKNRGLLNLKPGDKELQAGEREDGKQIFQMVADLNQLYRSNKALWEKDDNGWDIEWIEKNHKEKAMIAYRRTSSEGEKIACFHNFAGNEPIRYTVAAEACDPVEIFNSDSAGYGGQGGVNPAIRLIKKRGKYFYTITIPPMSTVMIREKKRELERAE